MTFTLDITLILEVLLFLVALTLSAYLMWPSGKSRGDAKPSGRQASEEAAAEEHTVTKVIHHYHYVIRQEDGKDVVDQETDSDMDCEESSGYGVPPDADSWTRESIQMLNSLSFDPDPESRARKIDKLIALGLASEDERDTLMNARVDVSIEEPEQPEDPVMPELVPEEYFGPPPPESGFGMDLFDYSNNQ